MRFYTRCLMGYVFVLLLMWTPANAQDLDGDGWTVEDGDCCDVPTAECPSPELVNPGAYDIPDNGFDDDCDGTVDNPTPLDCSLHIDFDPVALDLAAAMELCQLADANPPLVDRRWGLIDAQLLKADGSPIPSTYHQLAVRSGFGPGFPPRVGATLAILSTGVARTPVDPGFVAPAPGTIAGNTSPPPADWLAANGGAFYNLAGCYDSNTDQVFDCIRLRLKIRVPTNANGFEIQTAFLTAEYPDVCLSEYNDHLIGLLDSEVVGLPADGNIIFDSLGLPIAVHTAFFDVCSGCLPYGSGPLNGTGFDPYDDGAVYWVQQYAPVLPGEVMTLDLIIWDTQDGGYDSTALIDAFAWYFIPWADLSAVDGQGSGLITRLVAAYPNPFNPVTEIRFDLAQPAIVSLKVFDISGRLVQSLIDNEHMGAGHYERRWGGTDRQDRLVPSGAYICRLTAGPYTETRRMMLLR